MSQEEETQAGPWPPAIDVPAGNLEVWTLFQFLVADFQAVWDALVARTGAATGTARSLAEVASAGTGANFMLAKQAIVLLELACRVAKQEGPEGMAIRQFSERLAAQDRRYFAELPCGVPMPKDFTLPYRPGVARDRQVVALLFDLIRNGLAHYYQQIPAQLSDGTIFAITISGAEPGGPTYAQCRNDPAHRADHLALVERENSLWLVVRPELLMIDFAIASRTAALFSSTLALKYFERELECTAAELRTALGG